MQVGGKIWGSNYTQKKMFYQPGTYAKQLNRAASDQFFNTQKAAISNIFGTSATVGASSLELTLRAIGQRAQDEFAAKQKESAAIASSIDLKV
jgi:hypothetical protein